MVQYGDDDDYWFSGNVEKQHYFIFGEKLMDYNFIYFVIFMKLLKNIHFRLGSMFVHRKQYFLKLFYFESKTKSLLNILVLLFMVIYRTNITYS